MKVHFKVLNTSLKGLQIEVDKDVVRVGRSSDNDLVLEQRSVSREHAVLRAKNGTLTVEDNESKNKTEVGGQIIFSETPLSDGSIVSFGDVAVEVSMPNGQDSPASAPDQLDQFEGTLATTSPTHQDLGSVSENKAAETSPQGPDVPAGWVARQEGGELATTEDRGKALERQLWPAITLVLGLAVAGLFALFFLKRGGGDRPEHEFGVAFHLGEKKVVQVPRGFVYNPQVRPQGALNVKRPLNMPIAVQLEANSAGVATIRLHNKAQAYILLHANVTPQEEENVADLFNPQLQTRQQRLSRARQHIRRAERYRIERETYRALQQYEKASRVLEPLAQNPPEELQEAEQWKDRLRRRIESEYEELTFAMSNYIKSGDKRMALQTLAQIKELIPDENDVRYQNADLLYQLLERVVEREQERARRGL